jgi:hypothetical protein
LRSLPYAACSRLSPLRIADHAAAVADDCTMLIR